MENVKLLSLGALYKQTLAMCTHTIYEMFTKYVSSNTALSFL